jgi:hypothetical protein
MTENRALATGRRPVGEGLGSLLLVCMALVLLGGCLAGGTGALYEARGNVPKAQAWLSEAKSERPGSTRTRGGTGKSLGGVASLVDEAAGLSQEVLDARFLEVELEVPGPRLSGDVSVLEKQLAALEKTPPVGATGHPLWREYLDYGRERVADLRQGKKPKDLDSMKRAMLATQKDVPGVEVLFQ